MASQTSTAPATVRRDRLLFLDQLRGVAIILVFLFHSVYQVLGRDQLGWNGWLRDFNVPVAFFGFYPITWGWCGVAVFFALSGFSIHLSHSRAQQDSFADYFVRRLFRIYPPFLLSLLFFGLLFPRSRLDLHTRFGLVQFFSHFVLLHNLNAQTSRGVAVAWWSIGVEFQLYLLYPLLLLAARRIGWRGILIGTASVEILLRLAGEIYFLRTGRDSWAVLRNSPFFFWYSWTIGAAVAEAWLKGQPIPFSRQSPWLWVGLFVLADFFKPLYVFSFMFAALATAAVIARLLSRPTGEAPEERPLFHRHLADHLRIVGLCSYSIYLIHHPIVEAWPAVINAALPSVHRYPLAMYACCLSIWIVIFPIAWLMYRWIELPTISIGKRLIHRAHERRLKPGGIKIAKPANV